MRPTVPRRARVLDALGLLLFLVGAGLWVRAWLGFQEVRGYAPQPEDGLWAALRMAEGFARLQRLGIGAMVGGLAVFGIAWWVARRAGRARAGDQTPDGPDPPQRPADPVPPATP